MTKQTLATLNKKIATLQAQADAIKKKEAAAVIARVKDAIAYYGITAADLGLTKRGPKPKAAAKAGRSGATKAKKGAKYKDGNGNTWTGHGRRPAWFIAAIASGKTEEQLRA